MLEALPADVIGPVKSSLASEATIEAVAQHGPVDQLPLDGTLDLHCFVSNSMELSKNDQECVLLKARVFSPAFGFRFVCWKILSESMCFSRKN